MSIEGLGRKFQEARKARNLSLEEAARLTKIRPSRLAEIEADDFSQFPSLAYAKGFLQIYGRFLDVDVTPYLDVFETSRDVTVDGYSYLQDQPAPKARRIRTTRAPVVRRQRSSGDRRSPFPILIGVGVIVVGFILMRLIMNIQRIAPHQMVGVPQPTTAQSPAPQAAPVVATVAPSIAPPEAFVPAFANANPAAKASVAPKEATAKASVAPKEPEVRRAEPVRPEDLAKAGATQTAQTTQTAQ